ncbi:MAG TPA: hypothetical protein VFK59_07715 [Actinomycetota bacterium]|nr:hypothetical protein [Actinomycetota bacterium]
MCLPCATPVRGKAYGVECLASVLGADLAAAAEQPVRAPDARARSVARLGFLFATLATVLPWSRFGPGAEAFGAWSRASRWSLVAALAAVLGLGLSLVQRSPRLRSRGWDLAVAALGAAVTVTALLFVAFPPAFSRPWLGPWIAAAAGALACGATVVAARTAAPAAVRI